MFSQLWISCLNGTITYQLCFELLLINTQFQCVHVLSVVDFLFKQNHHLSAVNFELLLINIQFQCVHVLSVDCLELSKLSSVHVFRASVAQFQGRKSVGTLREIHLRVWHSWYKLVWFCMELIGTLREIHLSRCLRVWHSWYKLVWFYMELIGTLREILLFLLFIAFI